MGVEKTSMVRSDLVVRLMDDNPHLTQPDVEKIVEIFFQSIVDHLSEGGRVELRGFGAFSARASDARQGRNPKTGETVSIPAKARPFFKAGKLLAARVDGRKSEA